MCKKTPKEGRYSQHLGCLLSDVDDTTGCGEKMTVIPAASPDVDILRYPLMS